MSFIMTISLSIPSNTLSALAPASDTDMREEMIRPLGTILIAAYLPVMACLAILTRPTQYKRVILAIDIERRTGRSLANSPSYSPLPDHFLI